MPRSALEVADIFRNHGPAWRAANAGHASLAQLRVMSAIETCRSWSVRRLIRGINRSDNALGGHVVACDACGREHVAYNSCKNRHCPKCQGERGPWPQWGHASPSNAARDWMEAQGADLLPSGPCSP